MAKRTCGSSSDGTHEVDELSKDVLMEILSWLPGKSLLRFESVSKYWFSLITHPVFVEMHHVHSYARDGGTSLVRITSVRHKQHCHNYYFVMNVKKEADRAKVSRHKFPDNQHARSNTVNGLICFYNVYFDENISLYNISTREFLSLPSPGRVNKYRHYLLGFDPINKEYKVLGIWKDGLQIICEVLTVGSKENRWRPIDLSYMGSSFSASLIGEYLNDLGLSVDMMLYWRGSYIKDIILFDVHHERFGIIKYPTGELVREYGMLLTHIRGHLLLVHIALQKPCLPGKFHITLWKLIEEKSNAKLSYWKKEVTSCQFPEPTPRSSWFFCNHFGNVFPVRLPISEEYIVDCYDLESGEYKDLRINHAEALLAHENYPFTSYLVVENITPLKDIGTYKIAL